MTPAQSADEAYGRLLYLVEQLASLHGGSTLPWITGRFEYLGEKALGAELTALALPDPGGVWRTASSSSPRPAAARRLWEELALGQLTPQDAAQAVLTRVADDGQITDVPLSELFPSAAATEGLRALVAPIAFNRETIGVGLFVLEPGDEVRTLAGIVADHSAVAIRQLRERDDARRLHAMDPRLWVPDEDFLVAQLRREVARARRYGRQVGLAVLRLAPEIEVRERFGDFFTDHMLRRIGGQLLATVRDSDVVGALQGGYAVIHTETPREGTQLSAQRLADAVSEKLRERFPEAGDLRMTVDVAAYPEDAGTAEDLMTMVRAAPSDAGELQRERRAA